MKRASQGLAGAVVLAGGSQAYGAVVSATLPPDANFPQGTAPTPGTFDATPGNFSYDVNGDSVLDFYFQVRHLGTPNGGQGVDWQANMNPFTGTAATNGLLSYQGAFIRYGEALGLNTIIGPTPPSNTPALTFSTGTQITLGSRYFSGGAPDYYGGFATGPTPPGTPGFVGFRFNLGGATHYGYLELSVNRGTIDFISAAYETTPGMAITTPIPEPGTLALLALGAAGVAGAQVRRRRSQASA